MTARSAIWFRRDLRRSDHPALHGALAAADETVAVFVVDDRLWSRAGAPRRWFLAGCLARLDADLDGRLVVRHGPPARVIPSLAREVGVRDVFCTADFGPYGAARDREVAGVLAADGRALHGVDTPYAVPPGELRNGSGDTYRVFTPFARAWRDRGWARPVAAPPRPLSLLDTVATDPLPAVADLDADLPDPGEGAARRRLDAFLRRSASTYDRDRDRPDLDRTSRLSPYLKWGCLHPRQVLARLDPADPGHRTLETELAWREFYAHITAAWPESARASFRPAMANLQVDSGPDADARFSAWADGRTGYPIVDAGMRQLRREGWVHNRVRMIVASFLVKDLHLDWRRGAAHFMAWLVDADLASNQHGWQWVAGTGTDAAPFHRIFNPVTQSRRFDPRGDYIRRYLPELAHLTGSRIHAPWEHEPDRPTEYPLPIVDHAEERREALWRYEHRP